MEPAPRSRISHSGLAAAGKINNIPFDSQIKWTCYELWHHQGRRSRMGASTMGNDYVQWQGKYEVAKIFYGEFLPEAEQLMPGITASIRDSNAWMNGLTPETRQEMMQYYQKMWRAQAPLAGHPPTHSPTGPPATSAQGVHEITVSAIITQRSKPDAKQLTM